MIGVVWLVGCGDDGERGSDPPIVDPVDDTGEPDAALHPPPTTAACSSWEVARDDVGAGHLSTTLTELVPETLAPVRIATDERADGAIDFVDERDYANDGTTLVGRVIDADGDGVAEERAAYIYDPRGRPAGYRLDDDGDEKWDLSAAYVRDRKGLVVRVDLDRRDDGTVDGTETWTYARGKLARIEVDADGDGLPERLATWVWTGDDSVESRDLDADGDVDLVLERRFDEDGRLVYEAERDAADGSSHEVTYTYASAGSDDLARTLTVDQPSPAERTETAESWTYEGPGRPATARSVVTFADGHVDRGSRELTWRCPDAPVRPPRIAFPGGRGANLSPDPSEVADVP